MHTKKDIDKLAADFGRCQKILLALDSFIQISSPLQFFILFA